MSTYKRRRLLVDRQLQLSMVFHALVAVVLILVIAIAGSIAPLVWQLSDGRSQDHEAAAIVMLYLHERFWPLAFAGALIAGAFALHYSHRIAGPLVRVRRHLRQLGDGEISPQLRSRRRDFLKVEVECLNFAVAGVGQRIEAIQRAHHAVEQAYADLELAHCPAPDEALANAVAELGVAVRAFRLSERSAAAGSYDARQASRPFLVVDDA
ncbi:MAG: hypothetical protein NXI31_20625 [bacterium]|nr:hypothetical protein [bacterium]